MVGIKANFSAFMNPENVTINGSYIRGLIDT